MTNHLTPADRAWLTAHDIHTLIPATDRHNINLAWTDRTAPQLAQLNRALNITSGTLPLAIPATLAAAAITAVAANGWHPVAQAAAITATIAVFLTTGITVPLLAARAIQQRINAIHDTRPPA